MATVKKCDVCGRVHGDDGIQVSNKAQAVISEAKVKELGTAGCIVTAHISIPGGRVPDLCHSCWHRFLAPLADAYAPEK